MTPDEIEVRIILRVSAVTLPRTEGTASSGEFQWLT